MNVGIQYGCLFNCIDDISKDVGRPYSGKFRYAELDINSTISYHTLFVVLLIQNKLM